MFVSEIQSGIARQFYWPNDHLQVFAETRDGMRWVRLDRDACAREGHLMRHCVGQEPYPIEVADNSCELYSLRDRNNLPHVTVEFSRFGLLLEQAKGKANSTPIKYRQHLLDFLNRKYQLDRFDLAPQAIYDLLALYVHCDGEQFSVYEGDSSPQMIADMFMNMVQWNNR